MYLVSVDPSMRNLGLAIFYVDAITGIPELLALKSIQATHVANMTSQQIAHTMVESVKHQIYCTIAGHLQNWEWESEDITLKLITELQENFDGPKGVDAKASGSIQKLYFFTGMLVEAFSKFTRVTRHSKCVFGVTPTVWKGQVPKDVTMRRAEQWCESKGWPIETGATFDAWDALMIGKFALEHNEKLVPLQLPIPVTYFTTRIHFGD